MTDLTKIEKPFGLLDTETQRALKECGGPWDAFETLGWNMLADKPGFHPTVTYRQTERQETFTGECWAYHYTSTGPSLATHNANGSCTPGKWTATRINGKLHSITWEADE